MNAENQKPRRWASLHPLGLSKNLFNPRAGSNPSLHGRFNMRQTFTATFKSFNRFTH